MIPIRKTMNSPKLKASLACLNPAGISKVPTSGITKDA